MIFDLLLISDYFIASVHKFINRKLFHDVYVACTVRIKTNSLHARVLAAVSYRRSVCNMI